MFYIYKATCISPQQTFKSIDLETLHIAVDGKLLAVEPRYEGVPANILRRMGKAVKLGIAAAMPLISPEHPPAGIIIGAGNGGMEESGRFLNQIVEYDEDMLAPGNFVQGTPNSIASQFCMLLQKRNYNNTHVQRGHSFEAAVLDAAMLLNEQPDDITYLLGGVDEIAAYNYNIDLLQGWFRTTANNQSLYQDAAPGTIAGEGAALFLIGKKPDHAIAEFKAISLTHSNDITVFKQQLQQFLEKNLPIGAVIDLLLSGDSGDSRQTGFYTVSEELIDAEGTIARFKHMSGEYPTASSFALWLACMVLSDQIALPQHAIKKQGSGKPVNTILIHNTHKGFQHSFMLVKRMGA